MSSKSIHDVLGWVALTKAVNTIKDGVPNPFPPYLLAASESGRVVGNSVKFNRTVGERKTARVAEYGAAPHLRELKDEESVSAKLIHFNEEQVMDPLLMQALRDYESYDNQAKGKRTIAHNVKTFGTLFGNARVVALATSLAYGAIYYDSDGNLLPTSSGATVTVSQQVAAANIGSITDNSSNGIFGATGTGGSWANNATDIPLQLRRLQKLASQNHGYKPRVALYGENIPSYLSQNDYVLDYMARNQGMNSSWLSDGGVPDGLFGFQWVPAWEASYTKYDGTKTSLWPANVVTFLPGEQDKSEWFELFEGSYMVPTTLSLVSDASAAMDAMKMVFGAGAYGVLGHKPPSISTVMFDTFLPAFKNSTVVYIADVVT